MIQIREIDPLHAADINLPNEPFRLFGRLVVSYTDEQWHYKTHDFPEDQITEMTFPDEPYCYDAMADSRFLGAYDGEKCIGLAVLQPGFFRYMYLYDLKVNQAYRGQHIGQTLLQKTKEIAVSQGYCGIYTQCQDNNLGACLFYLRSGFHIGGLDTNVYRHTAQEGKSDILFYCEAL